MNGIEFLKLLRAEPKYRFTSLLLTTELGMNIKMEGKKVGATGWLVKRFNPT